MKPGVFNPVLYDMSFEQACEYLKSLGVTAIEIGCGGYPGKKHCDPDILLNDDAKLKEFLNILDKNDLWISGFSAHGNPVHPNMQTARNFDKDLTNAILLAEKAGVDTVIGFSGCPGDSEGAKMPNWVTCFWPFDFSEILKYQWEQVLIPYWKEKAKFAKEHGVKKIALEMHPGFTVYNTGSLLRLREAVGEEIGANFDPSHLFWQGIDPSIAIRELGKHNAIFHFHAKDTKIDPLNCPLNGVLDTGKYTSESERSWIFRTVGYGHDMLVWKDIVSALKLAGYKGSLSIEHEDSLMSTKEGLEKAVSFLKEILIFEDSDGAYWS